MKFGDKLIALRKKNGLSQEELAAKLNVSRQSVSKWESNNSYPETDKIVQICNLFDCSMDDLINENITDLENIERKNKNNINIVFDSFLEFITKTINMFSDMKFISGLKCIIEMVIMALILLLLGAIFVQLFSYVISNMFAFLSNSSLHLLTGMLEGLLSILWFVFSLIILVHIFKIRYLNYYDKVTNEKNEEYKEEKESKKEKIKFEKKETVVIRDEKHRPFAFLSVCSKIIIFFIKAFAIFIGLLFVSSLVFLVVGLVISLYLSFSSKLFIGSTLSLVSASIINIIILMIIIGFIFNKKYNFKVLLTTFLISLVVTGLGMGLFIINIKNIDIKYDSKDLLRLNKHEDVIEYSDDMIINNFEHNIKYVIDNEVDSNKIKIVTTYDDRYIYNENHTSLVYGIKSYVIADYDKTSIKPYQIVVDDLKNNILREDYSILYNHFDVEVHANEEVINRLLENLKRLYNYNIYKEDNVYDIYDLEYKIEDSTGDLCKYNAITNTMDCKEDNDRCFIKNTDRKIRLYCEYEDLE